MKNMTRGILLLLVAWATSVSYGGQAARGVAGVGVVVKESPGKRAVTGANGSFALDALPPGSYTLTFRAQKAQETKSKTTDKVTVATSYSIKIDGTKRSVNQSGVTSDKLVAGLDVPVQVGAGGTIRGQVSAGALKKMVWISQEPGSNIPGHWAEAGSDEAARRHDTQTLSREDLMNTLHRGNANMKDPTAAGGISRESSGR
jgi:hypothetical protein